MSDLAKLIRTRGHWEVVIRPIEFHATALTYAQLEPLVRESVVAATGWPFPYFHEPDVSRETDWVGAEVEFNHYKELWRFHRSGQFVFLGGLGWDWRDASGLWPAYSKWTPNEGLPVVSSLLAITEYCEFAARLAARTPVLERIVLSISFAPLEGRKLFFDDPNRDPTIFQKPFSGDAWEWLGELTLADLAGKVPELATQIANDLFSRMSWEIPGETARAIQERSLGSIFP